jgi:DNA-directed RNA polymerase II subunit RPB1
MASTSMDTTIHEPVLNVTSIDFDILGNDEIKKASVLTVVHPDTYEASAPKLGGLIDTRLGVTDYSLVCSTCKENYVRCPGHFGHVKLTDPVFHWGFMSYVKNVLSCVCLKSCKLLVPSSELQKQLNAKSRRARFQEIRALCSSVKISPYSGIPVPKLTIDVKKNSGLITLIAEYVVSLSHETILSDIGGGPQTIVETYGDTKKKVRQMLSASECFYILNNISPMDCEMMGIQHPSNMILENFPVPPVCIRPSIKGEFVSQGYSEHASTHKISDIVKFNLKLEREKERSLTVPDNQRYIRDYRDCVQYHVATYFDNESMTLPKCELKSGSGNAARSITYRFKGGKTGRIRGNLQGKRVDFSARTVITSDPYNNVDELGIPLKIAKIITYPEIVTPYNIEKLTETVRRGRDNYPGANYVETTHMQGPDGKPVRIDLRYRSHNVTLRFGWVVHRHLCDGDVVLFNRQPSLHKMSMMAHIVRVINDPSLITFRMNVTATDPYNADFDGDEMNLFAPQSEQAKEELLRLADIKNHIVSPRNSKPIVTLKQDSLLGTYKFTDDNNILSWQDTMILLTQTSLRERLIDGSIKIDKNRTYSGRDIISFITPGRVNLDNGKVVVKNGIIEKGQISKREIGKTKNSIPHLIVDSYSKTRAARYMDDIQRVIINWLMMYSGFTVGLMDTVIDKDVADTIKENIRRKTLEVCNLITETEDTHMIDRSNFEEYTFHELAAVISDQISIIQKAIKPSNAIYVMVESGSKGNWNNIGHIMGCLGQSPFEGKLIPKKINGRALPHFPKQDDRPYARGFITRPYNEGISPTEFFFYMMDGRSGLIDQAIKTADTGYMQRRTIKATEDVYQAYDMTVRNSTGNIIQWVYGDSGYDTGKQMEVKSRMIIMDNNTLEKSFGFTEDERKRLHISTADNRTLIELLKHDRDLLRQFQAKAVMNSKVVKDLFYLPFHVTRVIQYHSSKGRSAKKKQEEKPSVKEILESIDYLCSARTSKVLAMTKSQMDDPTSVKYKNDMKHKSLFRILMREQLSPRKILIDYDMNRAQFKDMIEELILSFNRNMVQPCEMVGILAAQSIGEPLTQFTLNTFHSSGMSDMGDLSAMARFKELIGFSRNVKGPIIRVYLDDDIACNEKAAQTILYNIQNTHLHHLVTRSTVIWDTTGNHTILKDDMISDPRAVFPVVGPAVGDIKLLSRAAPWTFRFEVDRMELLKRGMDLLTLKMTFVEFWETFLDQKGIKKKEKELFGLVSSLYIMSSEENSETPVLHIRVELKTYDAIVLNDLTDFFTTRFRVQGLPGVVKAVCKKELRKRFHPDTGGLVEEDEWVITVQGTGGVTIRELLMLEGVDISRTTTNDVFTIYQLMGIEATRAALIKEFDKAYSEAGGEINYQHLSVLVDIMTHGGTVTPVNRYGINKLDTDPLSRASFEKTVEQLVQAAVFQEVDKVSSVSSRIMLGRVIRGGTGMVGILTDLERFEQTENVEHRYLTQLSMKSDTPVPKLTPDPYISNIFRLLQVEAY